jgi:hypothetical protein
MWRTPGLSIRFWILWIERWQLRDVVRQRGERQSDAWLPTGGVYPLSMGGNTIDFAFSYGTSFLDGTITLLNITDGTNAPRFIGGLNITSSNIPGFVDGGYADLDFNAYLGSNPTIDQVYSGLAHSTEGPLSSGEIVPAATPEPSSIALFGSGVLGLAGLLRRKLNR